MRITHLIPYVERAYGGPVCAVSELTGGLVRRRHTVQLCGGVGRGDGDAVTFPQGVEVLPCQCVGGSGPFRWAPSLPRVLRETECDILHSHGLWTYFSLAAARAAKAQRVPHVLAPCGMLQGPALRSSQLKKKIWLALFTRRVLRRADCLHAKSETEYAGLRRFGLNNPVAIVPNPISPGVAPSEAALNEFRRRLGLDPETRVLLYLGRLHPTKGLERLLAAWASLKRHHGSWRLLLVGPDQNNYRQLLENRARALGCVDSVSLPGPLWDADKWLAYRAADAFVMPGDFESFGTAVAEAMLAGLPVITTTGTPWKTVQDHACGWWVAPDRQALTCALGEAMSLAPEERRGRGNSARELASGFASETVIEQMLSVYGWLLGHSECPACAQIAAKPS